MMDDQLQLRIAVSVHQGWQRIGLDEQVIEIKADARALDMLSASCGAAVANVAWRAVCAASEEVKRREAEEAASPEEAEGEAFDDMAF